MPTTALPDLYSPGSFETIVCAEPWPCGEAIAVAACESGTDRNGKLDGNWATDGYSYGLFQINAIHADRWADFWSAWSDPVKNTEWAFEIYSEQGWSPWSCSP
jgi:Lysozyme like domain